MGTCLGIIGPFFTATCPLQELVDIIAHLLSEGVGAVVVVEECTCNDDSVLLNHWPLTTHAYRVAVCNQVTCQTDGNLSWDNRSILHSDMSITVIGVYYSTPVIRRLMGTCLGIIGPFFTATCPLQELVDVMAHLLSEGVEAVVVVEECTCNDDSVLLNHWPLTTHAYRVAVCNQVTCQTDGNLSWDNRSILHSDMSITGIGGYYSTPVIRRLMGTCLGIIGPFFTATCPLQELVDIIAHLLSEGVGAVVVVEECTCNDD
ncbi:hypothetical protein J6590_024974 [Homalodisca vitripennis]|nr:hypothetical protein J6590_024974 [Homalodisca vitripennis]